MHRSSDFQLKINSCLSESRRTGRLWFQLGIGQSIKGSSRNLAGNLKISILPSPSPWPCNRPRRRGEERGNLRSWWLHVKPGRSVILDSIKHLSPPISLTAWSPPLHCLQTLRLQVTWKHRLLIIPPALVFHSSPAWAPALPGREDLGKTETLAQSYRHFLGFKLLGLKSNARLSVFPDRCTVVVRDHSLNYCILNMLQKLLPLQTRVSYYFLWSKYLLSWGFSLHHKCTEL